MPSCWPGSTAGCRTWRKGEPHDGHDGCQGPPAGAGPGAVPSALPGRGGLRRARRRACLLGALRRRRPHDPAAAHLDADPLAGVEGSDRLPGSPRSCGDVRPAGQRQVRSAPGPRALRRVRVRRRRRRGHGRHRHGKGGDRIDLPRGAACAAPRRRPPRARARGRVHRAVVPGQPAARAALADHGAPADAQVDVPAPAGATGGELLAVPDGGHLPQARKPVPVNLALRELMERGEARRNGRPARDPTVHRSDGRPRALYISSPIGLGHAQRDVAIAKELRALVPDLQIDWLAQHPVTRVLQDEGERIHPASAHLANESRHIESESAEHDLHCFQAWRRMDEILIANFMLFHDVARDGGYNLWIADEGWEIDYYLHEHPNEKRANYAWLTDFVGWLPMPDGGSHEAFLTADYNGEMVGHIARHPEVRDRALFVGHPEDIVGDRLGPQLPLIPAWTERNFDFVGYD